MLRKEDPGLMPVVPRRGSCGSSSVGRCLSCPHVECGVNFGKTDTAYSSIQETWDELGIEEEMARNKPKEHVGSLNDKKSCVPVIRVLNSLI